MIPRINSFNDRPDGNLQKWFINKHNYLLSVFSIFSVWNKQYFKNDHCFYIKKIKQRNKFHIIMCQFSRSSNMLNYLILNISNYNIFTYRFFPKMNSFNVLVPKYRFRPYQSCFKLKVNLFFPKLFKKKNKSNAQTQTDIFITNWYLHSHSWMFDCGIRFVDFNPDVRFMWFLLRRKYCLFYMCVLEVRLQVVIKKLLVSLITILDFYLLQKLKYLKTSKKIPFDCLSQPLAWSQSFFSTVTRWLTVQFIKREKILIFAIYF